MWVKLDSMRLILSETATFIHNYFSKPSSTRLTIWVYVLHNEMKWKVGRWTERSPCFECPLVWGVLKLLGCILGFTGSLEADVGAANTADLDWDPETAFVPSVKWILSLTAVGKWHTINPLILRQCVTNKHTDACTANVCTANRVLL